MVTVWTKEKSPGCEAEGTSDRQNHGSPKNGFHSPGSTGPQALCQALHLTATELKHIGFLLCASTYWILQQGLIYLFFTTWEKWRKQSNITEQVELAPAQPAWLLGRCSLLSSEWLLVVVGRCEWVACVAPGSGGHQLPWSICVLGCGERGSSHHFREHVWDFNSRDDRWNHV